MAPGRSSALSPKNGHFSRGIRQSPTAAHRFHAKPEQLADQDGPASHFGGPCIGAGRVPWCHRAERTQFMPPDLAPSDLSLFTLFWQAHWIVKTVMIGLIVCSVWVGAIAVDKLILFSRTSKAMERVEQSFWSGQSLEELYRSMASKPNHSMAALFVAAMREWKRSFEGQPRSFAGLQMRIEKVMDVTITREIERLERRLLVLAKGGSARPFVRLF